MWKLRGRIKPRRTCWRWWTYGLVFVSRMERAIRRHKEQMQYTNESSTSREDSTGHTPINPAVRRQARTSAITRKLAQVLNTRVENKHLGMCVCFVVLAVILWQIPYQVYFLYAHMKHQVMAPPAETLLPNSDAHMFYYSWYDRPGVHGDEWSRWDDWSKESPNRRKYPGNPFDDIPSMYYPLRGPYSSWDRNVVMEHFQEIKLSGAGVAVVEWWPKGTERESMVDHDAFGDEIVLWEGSGSGSGSSIDDSAYHGDSHGCVRLVLDAAETAGIKVAFHLQNYAGRDAKSVHRDVRHIIHKYGGHPALYRDNKRSNDPNRRPAKNIPAFQSFDEKIEKNWMGDSLGLPVFYVYDSDHIPGMEWSKILCIEQTDDGSQSSSVRGSAYDGIFLGLYHAHSTSRNVIDHGCFDGFYTFYPADGFTEGSSVADFRLIDNWAKPRTLIFSGTIGPGFDISRRFIPPVDPSLDPTLEHQPVGPPKVSWLKQEVSLDGTVVKESSTYKVFKYTAPHVASFFNDTKGTKKTSWAWPRQGGNYYTRNADRIFSLAQLDYLSINSYNDWLSGSQIEPSRPHHGKLYRYQGYYGHVKERRCDGILDRYGLGDANLIIKYYQSQFDKPLAHSPQEWELYMCLGGPRLYLDLTRTIISKFSLKQLGWLGEMGKPGDEPYWKEHVARGPVKRPSKYKTQRRTKN